MPALEVEIVNKVTNLGAFAEEKAALSGALGGGFSPLGGGTVSFGGSLTREEQAVAAAQLSTIEKTKAGFKDMAGAANLAGGEVAGLTNKASALTSLGLTPMTAGLLGAAVGMGVLFEAGKSMVANAERNEIAQKNLSQAFAVQNRVLADYQSGIDAFIDKNARYISSEYDVKDAFAQGIRAGFDYNATVRLVNDAIDLSTAAHIDLGTAMDDLIKLRFGRASQEFAAMGIQIKGAVDPVHELTVATKAAEAADREKANADRALAEEVQRLHDKHTATKEDLMHLQDLKKKDTEATKKDTEAHKELALAQQELKDKGDKYAQQLDQVESKIKGARKDQSDLKQSSDELRITWEKLSNDNGPALESMLSAVIGKTDDFLNALRHSEPAFASISGSLLGLIKEFHDFGDAVDSDIDKLMRFFGVAKKTSAGTQMQQNRQRGLTSGR